MDHTQLRKLRQFVTEYSKNYSRNPEWNVIRQCDSFSMLHPETLTLLYRLSAKTEHWVLEIGAYVGGSTVAAASARLKDCRKILSIEPGGVYKEHPHIPSDDIMRDLRDNISRYGLTQNVVLLNGPSYRSDIISEVEQVLNGQKIGLLFIDADGDVGRDFRLFQHLLSDECILILDDYETDDTKGTIVCKWVNDAMNEGLVSELAVVKWGTWIGVYNSK